MINFSRLKKELLESKTVDPELFDMIEKEKYEERISKIDNMSEYFSDRLNNKIGNLRGKVIFRDPETKKIVLEKDNLIMMRTRVWLLEQLFNTDLPDNYKANSSPDRFIALFSVGSGGADVNNAPFTPFAPKYSDKDLGEKIPFVIENPDKENSDRLANDPSVYSKLDQNQLETYYETRTNPDGSTYYFAKRFANATPNNPLGDSRRWIIDNSDGSVAFSLKMYIEKEECRGNLINELGLWLGNYNSKTNKFSNMELASRITFNTESLSSLTKGIEIEYIIYI